MAAVIPVFGDEDAMGSHILEIIGGITPKALRSTLEEQYQGVDAWSMEEEGDDSVFYSDEDEKREVEPRGAVNSEAEEASPVDEHLEEERVPGIYHRERAAEDPPKHKEVESEDKSEDVIQSKVISGITFETDELINKHSATISSCEDRTVFTPSPKTSAEPESPEHLSEICRPRLVLRPEPKNTPCSFRADSCESSEVLSIPTLSKKKSSHPNSFNHLTSSKYSTLSYRRIRRGNTRQKIEEFEYMIMKL